MLLEVGTSDNLPHTELVEISAFSKTSFANTEKNFDASSLLMALVALNVAAVVYCVNPLVLSQVTAASNSLLAQ
jgi:hypothetical protein